MKRGRGCEWRVRDSDILRINSVRDSQERSARSSISSNGIDRTTLIDQFQETKYIYGNISFFSLSPLEPGHISSLLNHADYYHHPRHPIQVGCQWSSHSYFCHCPHCPWLPQCQVPRYIQRSRQDIQLLTDCFIRCRLLQVNT